MVASLSWRPIADLPEDWEDYGRPDLDELLRYWHDERRYLAESERVQQAENRLATRWGPSGDGRLVASTGERPP